MQIEIADQSKKWIELLTTFGPAAVFVFMVFVLLRIAGKKEPLDPEKQRIQTAAYLLVWISIFATAILIVIAYWKVNFPSEYVVKGVIRNLRDPELVNTSQELFLRVRPTVSKEFDYEWRLITKDKFKGNVVLLLVKTPGNTGPQLRYEIPIRDDYYRYPVEILYDRNTDSMNVADGKTVTPILPSVSPASSTRPQRSPQTGVVYADGDVQQDGTSPEELIKKLDAYNPIIKQNAVDELAKRGTAILPQIEKTLLDAGTTPVIRLGVLSVLTRMNEPARQAMGNEAKCKVATLAAGSEDRWIRIEALRLLNLGIKPGPGCAAPPSGFYQHKVEWRPIALADNPESKLFALDQDGTVYKIDGSAKLQIKKLFSIPKSWRAADLAATATEVFVTANGAVSQIFVYALASGKLVGLVLPFGETCTGLAVGGDTLYVATLGNGHAQVRSWSLQSRKSGASWDLHQFRSVGPMLFDQAQKRLLVTDPAGGRLSWLSPADGALKTLTQSAGYVTSVAATRRSLLAGSGGKVLAWSLITGAGEHPPEAVRGLQLKQISGLVSNPSGDLWVADGDRRLIAGPIPLP